MCFFLSNLFHNVFLPSKFLGLIMKASHPNLLYASLSVLVVPLALLSTMIFGFSLVNLSLSSPLQTLQFAYFFHQLCLFFVEKILIAFFSKNSLLLLFLSKISLILSTRFLLLELTTHHFTLLKLLFLPPSLSLT